jgi:hypothetical protein
VQPSAFTGIKVLWSEFPGAQPVATMEQRFRHVDRERLRREFEAICNPTVDPPPGLQPRTTPCPRCGVVAWRADFESGSIGVSERCSGCGGSPDDRPAPAAEPQRRVGYQRTWHVATEADRMAATLLGVREPTDASNDPIPGPALRSGFRWFWQTRRKRPNAVAWEHLDIAKMRRRAGLMAEAVR